jgi:hypothetical protein
MTIDWYTKVMAYYEENPNTTLHSDELESMLRDKHEAEQAKRIAQLETENAALKETLYNAETAVKEVLPQLELEHKLDLAQREIGRLKEIVTRLAKAPQSELARLRVEAGDYVGAWDKQEGD